MLRTREITKMDEAPKIHRGQFRKKSQKSGQSGVKLDTRAGYKFSQPAKFCRLRKFYNPANLQCFELFYFLLQFPSDF